MDALKYIGLVELTGLIRQQQITAVQAASHYLDRIDSLDPSIHAFLTVDRDGALKAAQEIDDRIRQGRPVGPLAGAPVGLKDIFVTQDLETTCGSRILQGWNPPYDGTVVSLLREADAVILGKLNMDEFAMGSSTEGSAFGPCKNPWDLERVPGGSSGGAGAAVAAGLCAAALGTDTGGSIRQPASFCGVVGLKPTYGRVSRYGVIAFASSLDQVGPLTRTVRDGAALMEILAVHDPMDSTCIPGPRGDYQTACDRDVAGLRLGVPEDHFTEGLAPCVERAVRTAIDVLEGRGMEIVPVDLPHAQYAVATYYLIATAEASANLARYDGVRFGHRAPGDLELSRMYGLTRRQGLGPEVKRRIMLGTFALSSGYYDAYYARAQKARTLIRHDFTRAFQRCDVIITPVSPTPAFELGALIDDPLQMYLSDIYTLSCNLAGLPGLSVPCGFSDEGLPIGMQVLGPPLGEEALFAVAADYEAATSWGERHPLDQGAP